MKFPVRTVFGLILMLLALAPVAQSQVVVYKLEFKNTGTNINYSFYDEGFVVAPAVGGSPSYLFTFRDDTGQRQYTKFVDFGEYFIAINRSERRAVLAADSDSEVNLFALQAIGEPNLKLKVDSAGFVSVVDAAMTLKGFVLSSDDESELPFDESVGSLGYAGASEVKALLQRDRTDRANSQLQSVAEYLVTLEAELQRKGYSEFVLGGGDEEDAGDGADDGTDTGTGDGTIPGDGATLPTLPDGSEVVLPAVPVG